MTEAIVQPIWNSETGILDIEVDAISTSDEGTDTEPLN
jgi:hypothetical protein